MAKRKDLGEADSQGGFSLSTLYVPGTVLKVLHTSSLAPLNKALREL